MFEAIQKIFGFLVYEPQLNLLYFLYKITNDIGVSIIILGVVVNLLLWPVIVKSYISGQKMRILGPKIRQIQARFKTTKQDDPATSIQKAKSMQAEMKAFYKKHGIETSVFFQVMFLQIFFASGVYYVVNNVSLSGGNNQISGIYNWVFGTTSVQFPNLAFGFLKIDQSSLSFIFLPIASLILSYLYGKYSFHWAPNAKIPVSAEDAQTPVDNGMGIDPVALQKNQEILIIYILPVITFLINASFSAGLNLYFATLSLFNLLRHIAITYFYANHVEKLMEDIANSDPEVVDKNSEKESLTDSEIATMATDQPIVVEVVEPVEVVK